MIGLYVHIPFCKSICSYCDFTKRVPKDKKMIDDYLLFLKKEYKKYNFKYDTIYIGGGTPSILDNEQLIFLLEIFKDQNPLEYTFECNPESISLEKMLILKKYNVNRISLGVETFDDKLLKIINRKHDKKMVIETIQELKKHFNNINIDLMYSIPTQDLNIIKSDLECFYNLNINHLSYYSLILEENTPFYIKYMKKELELNDIDKEQLEYEYIINDLNLHGYYQYEISNFCKKHESIHNKIYWNYDNFIGIGLGASSKYNNHRYTNHHLLSEYYNNKLDEDIKLSNEDIINEYMMMNLRLIKGINIKKTNELFNIDIFKKYNIEELIKNELLKIDNGYLKLTKKGIFLGNEVFMEFI